MRKPPPRDLCPPFGKRRETRRQNFSSRFNQSDQLALKDIRQSEGRKAIRTTRFNGSLNNCGGGHQVSYLNIYKAYRLSKLHETLSGVKSAEQRRYTFELILYIF